MSMKNLYEGADVLGFSNLVDINGKPVLIRLDKPLTAERVKELQQVADMANESGKLLKRFLWRHRQANPTGE
jgi:hypothetical protein